MAIYQHRRQANAKRIKPGYKNQLLLAPLSWFATIGTPATPTGRLIPGSAAHVFKHGFSFLEFYTAPHKNTAKSTTKGDFGSKDLDWAPAAFIPGDGPEVQELLEAFLEEELIVLFKDANCPATDFIQFGSTCAPARMVKMDFESGTTKDGNKGWVLEFSATDRFFYEGISTEQEPEPFLINGDLFLINDFPIQLT